MTKILLYSLLIVFGLVSSQFLGGLGEDWVQLGTMFCLSFIMIRLGYEFEIDKSKSKQYAWDYLVAGTAAMFPWLFCAGYFIWILDILRGAVNSSGFSSCISWMTSSNKVLDDMRLFLPHFKMLV